MSKFKQGDVVEMVESDCPYFKKGDKAILLNSGRDHNNNPDWSCDFTINDSYYKSGHWYASESAMKPIRKENSKFGVGTVVEMKKDHDFLFKKGDKAVLKDKVSNRWECDFTINKNYYGTGRWWIKESAIKFIRKEKGRKLKPQYKVGDHVVAVKGDIRDYIGVLIREYPDNKWVVRFTSGDKTEEWILREDEIKRDKEYKPEKGIRIEVEKILKNGEEYYKVLSINALRHDELPEEYCKAKESVWYDFYAQSEGLRTGKPCDMYWVLVKSQIYKKETFNQRIETIKEAGRMLGGINKKLKWSGKETIII